MWPLMIITLIMLIVCTISDIRERQINLTVILVSIIIALIYRGYVGSAWKGLEELIFRFVPGLIMLVISLLRKKLIGQGDAIMVLATGYILGGEYNLILLMGGTLGSSLYSLVMICLKKTKLGDSLPFAPFMLCGLLGLIIYVFIKKG